MKNLKVILTILILTTLLACNENSTTEKITKTKTTETQQKNKSSNTENIVSDKLLSYIGFLNEIVISHTDDKYGEWGGDTDLIKIYSDGNEIYANYYRFIGSSKPPMPPKKEEKSKKWYEYKTLESKIDSIKLNEHEKQLVVNAIVELLKSKLNNEDFPAHSGIYNRVISKDSSLIINDYPSIKWESFQKLKTELKTE
ncbi:hypothetical protein F3C99_04280 [Vitellibacter sp. q18]|nr:hypothetical protein [Aequorivita lutea]